MKRCCASAIVGSMVLLGAGCGVLPSTNDSSTTAPSSTAPAPSSASGSPSASAFGSSTPASSDTGSSPLGPSAPQATESPSAPTGWAAAFAQDSSGVLRIDVDYCEEGSYATGTGFLVSPTLVAPVAHVVEDTSSVRLTDPVLGVTLAGTVIGIDHDHDLALVRTDRPIDGHVFKLDDTQPEIGTEMALLGFPLGRSMQLTVGHITDRHDRRLVEGFDTPLSDLLLTDAAQNPGNSGGPWITQDGVAIALAESGPPVQGADSQERAEGNNAGVSAADALRHIAAWTSEPAEPPSCSSGGLSAEDQIIDALWGYFNDINESDYDSAYAQLDPRNHPISQRDAFVNGVLTSEDEAPDPDVDNYQFFAMDDLQVTDDTAAADVRFRSHQDADHGPDGLTCADWHLRYQLVKSGGVWLVHSSRALPGQAKYTGC